MTILSREDLTTLIAHESDVYVSIFMPTHKAGHQRRQDPILLKNLMAEARERLPELTSDDSNGQLLEPAESLRKDDEFWTHRQDGLALFCAKGLFRPYRLPLQLEASVHVNRQFYIRPLIQLLQGNARFFVLSLTQDHAELYEATKFSIRDLNLAAAMANVKQAVGGHDEGQALQFRTHGTMVPTGKGPALFHGHGGAVDVTKQEVLKYFQAVDRAVVKLLRGERAPLVLACVGYLASIYESANSYSGLIKGKVPGNPDMWDEDELRDRAWELASPMLNSERDQALHRIDKELGTDKVVTDVRQVVLAASDGRVDTLFLERNRKIWGNIDPDLRAVHVHNEPSRRAEELLDFAAAQTLIHGGNVYSIEPDCFPIDASAAALLRYAA